MKWTKRTMEVPIRIFIYLYLGAFLLGALAGNQIWKNSEFQDYLSVYAVLGRFQMQDVDGKTYALFLLKEKGGFVGVCMIAGFAGAGEILAVLASLWFGFLAGGLATVFLLQSGIQGFLYCMSGIFFQLLFYIPAILFFLLLMGKRTYPFLHYSFRSAKEIRYLVLMCLFFAAVMGIGIAIETYVNLELWGKIFF